ncbi:MAG: PAS domain S-box protein [Hydrogenimonas sp.]|nr:PAS domain S-box protein [Hydrogenimonas sp.]
MKNFINILKSSKILFPVLVTSIFLGAFLFYYIPYIMEDGLIKNIVRHSKNAVERLQMEREYYTLSVVRDVKKFAPQLSFDYNHEGVNAKLPFPTTTIHDLSRMYSKRSDVKFSLYSNYPFLNRKDRVLTPFQKEALKKVKENGGLYYKKDFIDGKPVLRVAVADYMVQQACVDCHNSHKLKNWPSDKWKLGDMRGVLEIMTPIDTAMGEMYASRNRVLFASLLIMLLLFIYYSYLLLRRESQLNMEKEELSEDLKDLSAHFDKYVIASKTDLNGIITYASERFCKISGFKRDELIGKTHSVVRHPDTPKELYQKMWERISNDKTWAGELKNRKKNGGYYWVKAVVMPLYNHKGEKVGYTSIRHDITDKKKIQDLNKTLEKRVAEEVRKNREKQKQMLHQSRLAQMGEMISMIAHQWRQPLAAISSCSLAIALKAKLGKLDKDTAIELSEKISEYSQHLSRTIDDFREFFKPNRGVEETTYKSLVESALSIVDISLKNRGIERRVDMRCESKLMTYPNELKQVILNLIKNAEEALVERKVENPVIEIVSYKDGESAVLEVRDNAGGVPDNIIDKIFDPYFSTKTEKNGTGLGLYMSKIIIEDHCKGKLTVENGSEGAIFKIVLEAAV